MAKILSFPPQLSAPRKVSQALKQGFFLLSARRAEEDPRVKIARKKDELQSHTHTQVRAIESFYL